MTSPQHISAGDKWRGLNQEHPGNATFQEFQEVFKLFPHLPEVDPNSKHTSELSAFADGPRDFK